jgi:hypothetical protein
MLNQKLLSILPWAGVLWIYAPLHAEEVPSVSVYNESALYACENSWDIKFTADYLYWNWQQALFQVGTVITPQASGAQAFFASQEDVIFQTPGYTSGFQVGLGCNFHGMDHWNLMVEYTWYQNNHSQRILTDSSQYFAVSPTLIKQVQGVNPGFLLSSDFSTSVALHFEGLDALLQRSAYLSSQIISTFGMGLKALWIHETASAFGTGLSYIQENAATPVSVAGTMQSSLDQRSWGLGPTFGFNAEWLLGMGIKIIGGAAFSVLYTSYTTLSTTVTGQISNRDSADLSFAQSSPYNTLNPVLESGIGLGWGSYFCHNNLFLNLALSYDWNVYWSYALLDVLFPAKGSPGSMTLRGVNARIGIDF